MAKRYRPLGFRRKGAQRAPTPQIPQPTHHQSALEERMRRNEELHEQELEKEEAWAAEHNRAN
jgi:hypothetical protein